MSEILPDFLDITAILPVEIKKHLGKIPHKLTDTFGNQISQGGHEKSNWVTVPIHLNGGTIAGIRVPVELQESLPGLIESAISHEFEATKRNCKIESNEIISQDLEKILRISEMDEMSFEEQLKHLLKILRTHVWSERASIFGIYDGFTLEGLAGVGGVDQQNWKLNFSTLAGEAATKRRVFHTENPKEEASFKAKEGAEVPRNLVCYPLLHGSTLVGVMNLSNRIGGAFSEIDLKIIERFSYVAAHLLQKQYFKMRMQSFEKTSDHLGKYLSSKVVKNVKSQNQIELGGVEKKVVCLFSDIRGYTSITEDISAARLVELLNFHFEKMTAIIDKYEGTVDKIVGDLIMAVWNMPHDQPEPELLAMKAALEMQKEMIRSVIPEWLKHDIPKVGMGVGVNSGIALAGNLGSSRFMNYTVIGDAINTAQRLEAKAQSGEIWMADSMYEFVSGKIEKPIRKESNIRLKGKDKTIDAYVYRPLSY